jgi:hypothetical protein
MKDMWYCSSACQKVHWKDHAATCKKLQARKMLERIVPLLQTGWHQFCKTTDPNVVKTIERHTNGELGVFCDSQEDILPGPTSGKPPCFTNDPLQLPVTEEERLAIETRRSSELAVSMSFAFLKSFLKGK